MDTTKTNIRTPVRREGAEKYLLITLLSFAGSLSLTRLFLEVTGYPQIGGGTLHIAHVLWGGLLLYIAALLPLLFANRWVYLWGSILCGVGIGLFIDEVGKFITQSNDYFFPPAAPIIYAFFLLSVLLYQRIRQSPHQDVRSHLYSILDGLEEVLDHDLSDRERSDMIQRLDSLVKQTDHPDLLRLIEGIRNFVECEELILTPEVPTVWQRTVQRAKEWEKRLITPRSYRAML
ncbi:MAG TPA: hypothetical protein VHO48_14025, partial [Anaerolineaceae bacterium]|nr:hypothetical protein [Anaerolineaceae bacterium]